jgi:hypothetical protein
VDDPEPRRAQPEAAEPHRSELPGVVELEQELRAERALLARRQRLLDVASQLFAVRAEQRPEARAVEPATQQAPRPGVVIDHTDDTRWAHPGATATRLVQVFHQEWHGIRAAAGYLPGRKVAIASDWLLGPLDMRRALEACQHAEAALLHSSSPNMRTFAQLLRWQAGSSLRIFAIWHGSTAQFHCDFEIEGFAELIALKRRGVLDGIACVKPGMHLLDAQVDERPLLNFPPRLDEPAPRRDRLRHAAFLPVPNEWRKNFYTNLFAAGGDKRLRDIYVTAPHVLPPELSLPARVIKLDRPSRTQLFQLLGDVDLVLNATLSECQPMTALEAMAHGIPCVTGPLSLGALDQHPLQRLAQVAGVDALEPVRQAIERLVDLAERSPAELRGLIDDYLVEHTRAAAVRLYELVGR